MHLGKQTVYTIICYVCADGPGASTYPGKSTDHGVSTEPGKTESSSNSGLVAGVAATVFVLVVAAVCIVVMVIWLR